MGLWYVNFATHSVASNTNNMPKYDIHVSYDALYNAIIRPIVNIQCHQSILFILYWHAFSVTSHNTTHDHGKVVLAIGLTGSSGKRTEYGYS